MDEFREELLATSIRMYSLHRTALSLCSVKRLNEFVEELLPQCITAMDVATACLLSRGGVLHILGSNLSAPDQAYLIGHPWRNANPWICSSLPSGAPFLASPIQKETQTLGTLIVVNKETADFEKGDFRRIRDLATITATALANVYEYEDLLQKTESLEEDIKRREETELQRLRRELEDARRTQLSLLPRQAPLLPGIEIEGVCLPAHEVGGDFYDYVSLWEDGILAIVLADVAGKGMKGAMYAVLSYGILHAEAKFGVYPSQMLWSLNDDLKARLQERMTCAMCIATIDVDKRILRYSNAGMPYPIVKRGREIFELKSSGMPLGGFRGFEYQDVEMELRSGDIFIFLSDGISECLSKDTPEQLYMETKRLFSVVNSFQPNMSVQEMIHAILADARDFSGDIEQGDDITLVVVKVHDESEQGRSARNGPPPSQGGVRGGSFPNGGEPPPFYPPLVRGEAIECCRSPAGK